MRTMGIFLIYAWLLWFSQPCLASDVLNAGENITVNGSLLVSVGQKFQLGFFSPSGTSTNYIGIWYYQSEDSSNGKTVVWVANRDNPVDSSGAFYIADDGNLVITDASGKSFIWSSNLESSSSRTNRRAVLMDNGNLVLLENHLGGGRSYCWQSFQHPTDTFLPGMKMDTITNLTCWKNASEPGTGNFTFKMASTGVDNRYVIFGNNQLHWESKESEKMYLNATFSLIVYLLSNFTLYTNPPESNNFRYKNVTSKPPPPIHYYDNKRLVMNSIGELQFLTRDSFQGDLSVYWKAPASFCEINNVCGTFSSCNSNNIVGSACKCLPGFSDKRDNSGQKGCIRKSASCRGQDITFLPLVMVKMGIPDRKFPAKKENECQSFCVKNCPYCQAYSYVALRRHSDSNCWIWTRDLNTLQEEYLDDSGRNLLVLVHKSDIAPTPKTCDPCGTNTVPYPLSTEPDCGDPMYLNFSCDYTTGQLSFTNKSYSYRVTSIVPRLRKFTIKVSSSDHYYNREDPTAIRFPIPFNETNCFGNEDDVEVTWQPPLEPVCTESEDCVGWNHSSCKETSGSKRCLCDTNYRWDGLSLNCIVKEAMSLDKPSSEEPKPGNSKGSLPLILGITLASAVVLACAIVFGFVMKRKQQDSESIQRNRLRFFDSERHVKDLIDESELEERDNEGIEVPYYDFESILLATNNFSDENKLGRGGYGPVYKGKLQGGEVIAVKRLSSVSAQGLKEFKNEVVLIAKLQHRNLVRLRGYCIKGEEKILLYEYMPNGSLDLVIFDSTRSAFLDWQRRFDIIVGIARGLLYLHQDSRLRVIHRDLKTSNILLDEEMQPKISDFGLARIVGGKETEANTERVVGTYGYMSPEYALDGFFSTKSDIFSFGVVLLEIISGKKNTGFYDISKQTSSLLGYAWRLYTENKLLDLMDMSLAETCNVHQFTKCAQIGLLCVQDEPGDRPTMSNVVTMLDSETATLPTPKQPTFFASRGLSSTASSKPEASLHFESSYQEGR